MCVALSSLAKKHGVTKHVGKLKETVTKVNKAIGDAERVGQQIAAIPGVGQKLEKMYLDKGGRTAYKRVKQGQRIMNEGNRNPSSLKKYVPAQYRNAV